jgi:CDP-diacylglycerol---serine O-phosphatidyltransferase
MLHGDARMRDRLRLRRPRIRRQRINQIIPNAITVAALCAGLTAIRFAVLGRWEWAVFAIIVAGIFDGLDGRLARLLGGTSKFGAELDSLSDFVCFGVAPGIMIYLWTLSAFGGFGWALVLLFAVCCALRLARFNTALGDPNPPSWAKFYFTGVPAPAGAGLVLLPMMATFELGPGYVDGPVVSGVTMVLVASLMISRIPTFSIKQIRLAPEHMLPALLLVGLTAAALTSAPWTTFLCVGLIYLGSIPVSVWTQREARRTSPPTATAMPPPALPSAGQTASPERSSPSVHHD